MDFRIHQDCMLYKIKLYIHLMLYLFFSAEQVHVDNDLQDDDDNDADDDEEMMEEEGETIADVEDVTIFDNLTWEVECTAKVWKILRDRHVQHRLKQVRLKKSRVMHNMGGRMHC